MRTAYTFVPLRNGRPAATIAVSRIAAYGSRSVRVSRTRKRWPGSVRSRALAQMHRVTADCTARKLARKPIRNRTWNPRAAPEPRWTVSVAAIGSATLPAITALRLGIARSKARPEYRTIRPTHSRPRKIALGTSRSGACASSATDPADSNPRKDQPTTAIAAISGPPIHDPPWATPGPFSRDPMEFV